MTVAAARPARAGPIARAAALPEALGGERLMLTGRAGSLAIYHPSAAAEPAGTPLLLIHSVNAAASAAEVRPVYEHAGARRPTYALELPGYGHSERSERAYTIRLMTDAVHAALGFVATRHGGVAVDALAVSLGCEFLARAAIEAPAGVRRLVFVSPTGLAGGSRQRNGHGPTESALGPRWLRTSLPGSALGRVLFRGLTRPAVIRYFLRRTWGKEAIDERVFEYAVATTRQPGAEHAPLHFVTGALFSADAATLYTQLRHPVWLCHGTQGDFSDYRGAAALAGKPNWRIEAMATGAFPYFEAPQAFHAGLDAFCA
jgi:pimeloyl-ACP methyl ester carboxylesterase